MAILFQEKEDEIRKAFIERPRPVSIVIPDWVAFSDDSDAHQFRLGYIAAMEKYQGIIDKMEEEAQNEAYDRDLSGE